MSEHEWQSFFACIEHQYFDEVMAILTSYDIQGYIVAKEISSASHQDTNGEHMHFVVQMHPSDYKRFADRVFIKRFKLRGRAVKGLSRQYGKLTNIENLERMKIYVLKDGNYVTNLPKDEIARLAQQSFEKNEDRSLIKEILDAMLENKIDMMEVDKHGVHLGTYRYLAPETFVVEYFRKNNVQKRISKRFIDGVVTDFLMSSQNSKIKTNDILHHLGYR